MARARLRATVRPDHDVAHNAQGREQQKPRPCASCVSPAGAQVMTSRYGVRAASGAGTAAAEIVLNCASPFSKSPPSIVSIYMTRVAPFAM